MPVPTVDLRPDYRVSRVIKGGWQLAGDHGPVDRAAALRDMTAFVDAGIDTFDCADIYAGVEEMIGVFLCELRQSRGSSAADGVHVHTKYVPDATALHEIDRHHVEAGIDRSLERLGVERLDLVQFHWWDYEVPGALDALGHLQQLRDKGKIRHLGLTNFDLDHVERFIQAGIDVLSVQVQFSLLDQRPAVGFADFCRLHGIALFAYGTLAGGFLSERWLGASDPGYAFENRSLIKYRLVIDEFGGWRLFQELLSVLNAIAQRHDVSLANVALRAMLDRGDLTAAILGARYARHLQDNLQALAFKPDETDGEALAAVLAKRRGPSGAVFGLERDRTTPHGQIFKKNLNANPADALLELDDVNKTFGAVRAVDGVSFQVKAGQMAGLIGPNGAGKTTIFNTLAGIHPPDSGAIRLDGQRIDGLEPYNVFRAGLSRTFQIPKPFPAMTVLENLMLVPERQAGEAFWNNWVRRATVRREEQAIREQAVEIITFCGLEPVMSDLAATLSGGQLKLLELARVLMADPKIILLDEPAAGVNPALLETLIEKLMELNRQGRSFLIIEHHIEMIMALCDPVMVMAGGKLIFNGRADAARQDQAVLDAYLGDLPS